MGPPGCSEMWPLAESRPGASRSSPPHRRGVYSLQLLLQTLPAFHGSQTPMQTGVLGPVCTSSRELTAACPAGSASTRVLWWPEISRDGALPRRHGRVMRPRASVFLPESVLLNIY